MHPPYASLMARMAATLVGMAAIAVATRLNLEHAAGADPTSPIGSAILVFGLVTAACAISAPRAWAEGRKLLASVIVFAAVTGEAFALFTSIERMANQRAERERQMASENIPRQLALQRLEMARSERVTAAQRAADATRGGCKRECTALREVEAEARQRLAQAEAEVAKLGATISVGSPLANLLGVKPLTVELGLAAMFGLALTLGGSGLVAFGTAGSASHKPTDGRRFSVPEPSIRAQGARAASRPLRSPIGQSTIAGHIVDLARASNGRLDASVRSLASTIGKPKSTVHGALTSLIAAGVLSKAADGSGYVLTM